MARGTWWFGEGEGARTRTARDRAVVRGADGGRATRQDSARGDKRRTRALDARLAGPCALIPLSHPGGNRGRPRGLGGLAPLGCRNELMLEGQVAGVDEMQVIEIELDHVRVVSAGPL